MSAEKGTGAITGITNFLFLAFILPGVVYLCFVLILFPFDSLKALFPKLEMGIDVAIGAILFLGLVITSIIFAVDLGIRWLLSKWSRKGQNQKFTAYSEIIFNADREKELGWYFWQLWGQSIMHQNIAGGILLLYVIYRLINFRICLGCGVSLTWVDGLTLAVILANLACWGIFSHWHGALMSKLSGGESGVDDKRNDSGKCQTSNASPAEPGELSTY